MLHADTKLVMVATYNFNGENKFHAQHEYNKVEGSIILSGVTFDKSPIEKAKKDDAHPIRMEGAEYTFTGCIFRTR